ncbi:sulfonate ABC transporter permease, partial [Burkholderia pseudomallei]
MSATRRATPHAAARERALAALDARPTRAPGFRRRWCAASRTEGDMMQHPDLLAGGRRHLRTLG